jgi:Icc-related predicted phosphoesterase
VTRIVCISDTHTLHEQLVVPDGDLLIHAGDFTNRGAIGDVEAFDAWLATLPHQHKIVIAGNHDFCFERTPDQAQACLTSCTYLQDSGVQVEGLTIWGSPWQPRFFDWAFNLDRGAPLREKWALIPQDTDILITHGPPWSHGDMCDHGGAAGCKELLARLREISPRLHVFGHIHEAYGVTQEGQTTCVNASICTLQYRPTQLPIVIDL